MYLKAARSGGALALTPPGDLDREQCLILLREKGGTVRWQPVAHADDPPDYHAEARGGLASGQRLLRYATGQSITARRYDYLWLRLGEHLPWVATQQVSVPTGSATRCLTWVERDFGFAVAQAYAGMRITAATRDPWPSISALDSLKSRWRCPSSLANGTRWRSPQGVAAPTISGNPEGQRHQTLT
jgi:hypothetical protein